MYDKLLGLLSMLQRPGEKLWGRLTAPLKLEVRGVGYESMESRPADGFVVITPFPSCYWADVRLVNRTDRVVVVQDVWIRIDNENTYQVAATLPRIRVDPHDLCDIDLTFPVDGNGPEIESGTYELHVKPTMGRECVSAGTFPF